MTELDGPTLRMEALVEAGKSGWATTTEYQSLLVVGLRFETDNDGVQLGSYYSSLCTFPIAPTAPIAIQDFPEHLTKDSKPPAFFIYAGIPFTIFLYNPTDCQAKVVMHLLTRVLA